MLHESLQNSTSIRFDSMIPILKITPRDVREVEAEAIALLCCESLGLPGAEFSRGYIQEWGKGQAITERSAQRIFRAADQILRSGRTEQATRDAG